MKLLRHFLVLVLALIFCIASAADNPRVLMKTSKGEITLELDAAKAPKSVANFMQYVKDGHYMGTIFHRVIDNFMIQGGGFDPQMQQLPTRAAIGNEAANGLKNEAYTIAMARTSEPHSATAQFFINVKDNAFLDYPGQDGWGYAVFGRVIKGEEVVNEINRVPTGAMDVPLDPVVIESVSLIR